MPHLDPPQLPGRPTPTEEPVTFSQKRIPQIQPANTAGIASIFADALKATKTVTEDFRKAQKAVDKAYSLEMPDHLVAIEIEMAENPDKDPALIIEEKLKGSVDAIEAAKMNVARTQADRDATLVVNDFLADDKTPFRERFDALKATQATMWGDPIMAAAYNKKLDENQIKLVRTLKANQFAATQRRTKRQSKKAIVQSFMSDMPRYFREASLKEGDTARPTYMLNNAADAWLAETYPQKESTDELTPDQRLQMRGAVRRGLFLTLSSDDFILSKQKRLELFNSFGFDKMPMSDLEREQFNKNVTAFEEAVVELNNELAQKSISVFTTKLNSVRTREDYERVLRELGPTFIDDPDNPGQRGNLPVGIDINGDAMFMEVPDEDLATLEALWVKVFDKNDRNFQIEERRKRGVALGIKRGNGATGDWDYIDSEYERRKRPVREGGLGMTNGESFADMLRTYKDPSVVTKHIINDADDLWKGGNREEAVNMLTMGLNERPGIAHEEAFLAMDDELRDVWNMLRTNQIDPEDLLASYRESALPKDEWDRIKVSVDTLVADTRPRGTNEFSQSGVTISQEALDLFSSTLTYYKRIDFSDRAAIRKADEAFENAVESVEFNGQEVRFLRLPVRTQDGQVVKNVYVTNESGDISTAYQEIANVLQEVSLTDRWSRDITANMQQVWISEDGKNWMVQVMQNDDGELKPGPWVNVPIDDADRQSLINALREVRTQLKKGARGRGRALFFGSFSATPEDLRSGRIKLFGGPTDILGSRPHTSKLPAFFPELRDKKDKGVR